MAYAPAPMRRLPPLAALLLCTACHLDVVDLGPGPDRSIPEHGGDLLANGVSGHVGVDLAWTPDASEIVYLDPYWLRIEAIDVTSREQRTIAAQPSTGQFERVLPSPTEKSVYGIWLDWESSTRRLLRYSRGLPGVTVGSGVGWEGLGPNGAGSAALQLSDRVAWAASGILVFYHVEWGG